MSGPCYIGDEVSAAGFRLAGARVTVPSEGDEATALAAARASATLILISAEIATRIPSRDLATAQAALAPLTLIVPDLKEEIPMTDLATTLRTELGLEDAR